MKFRPITLIFFILFSSDTYAKSLDTEDKQAVQEIVKTLATKLFLLKTSEYNSTSLQNELLVIMPDKIAIESEYDPITKQEYIDGAIRLGLFHKATHTKAIPKDVTPTCQYIEDDTIDCDFLERIKYIERAEVIPQKPFEYSAGTEYKFNLKMNELGEWYIHKMKAWNAVPAPKISTLKIEEEHKIKVAKKQSMQLIGATKDSDGLSRPLKTRRKFGDMQRHSKKTDLEIAEEEERKEAQERLLQQYEEESKIFEKSNALKILVDRNGNIIGRDTAKSPSANRNTLVKKKFEKITSSESASAKSGCHPIYGCKAGPNRGNLWVPMYARAYAMNYAMNYNSNYRRFYNDCANFVSQCLVNGGWQNDWGWHTRTDVWYYGWWTQSYTWAGASNLEKYLIYQTTKGNVSHELRWSTSLNPGDVLALTMSGPTAFASHMMIVTAVRNGQIYVSGHTADRMNKPWSEVDPYNRYWGMGYHILHGNLY